VLSNIKEMNNAMISVQNCTVIFLNQHLLDPMTLDSGSDKGTTIRSVYYMTLNTGYWNEIGYTLAARKA